MFSGAQIPAPWWRRLVAYYVVGISVVCVEHIARPAMRPRLVSTMSTSPTGLWLRHELRLGLRFGLRLGRVREVKPRRTRMFAVPSLHSLYKLPVFFFPSAPVLLTPTTPLGSLVVILIEPGEVFAGVEDLGVGKILKIVVEFLGKRRQLAAVRHCCFGMFANLAVGGPLIGRVC